MMTRRVVLLTGVLAVAALAGTSAQRAPVLTVEAGQFRLAGRPLQIISGEIHYPRIAREYWRDRLQKARAMGLNTISTYVFWNLHEAEPGRYDFSGEKDVAEFIRIAGREGLHVIVRPGPYVCAEWELGGYPAWLLADPGLTLRSIDERFTRPATRWLDRLGRELSPLSASRGGPIIAVQVENEYGSFDADRAYMTWQYDALVHAGFGEALLYTADGPSQLPRGALPEVPAVVNFGAGGAEGAFTRLQAFRPGGAMMSGEYWAGWFDQWGRPHAATNAAQQTRELTWMLERGYSVNLYMFHGGTTFGFMNGANMDRGRYLPQTTSYDYDAALDESGRPTPKYFTFRDAIARHTRETPPPAPETSPAIAIPEFKLDAVAPIFQSLGRSVHVDRPRSMETFGQSFGYILYRTSLKGPMKGDLAVADVRDYAQIYIDGWLVGTLDRRLNQDRVAIDVTAAAARLDILVENSGRVNFSKALLDERKGITKSVMLDGKELTGWDVFASVVPVSAATSRLTAGPNAPNPGPAFYDGSFELAATGDTFLDTRGWGKGTVWINGHHLGRFWSIGPQQTLYVPGPWLVRGRNHVRVFALQPPAKGTMAGLSRPILDDVPTPSIRSR